MKIIDLTSGNRSFVAISIITLCALKKSFEPREDSFCNIGFLVFSKVFYFELSGSV